MKVAEHTQQRPDPVAREESGTAGRAGGSSGVAAYVTSCGVAFLILRLFAVSDYHWDTAFAVSTTLRLDDGLALVFGSLMAGHLLTEVLLVFVVPLLLAAYLWGPRDHRPMVVLLSTLALATLAALTMSFHAWWLPLTTVAAFGLLAVLRALPLPKHLREVSAGLVSRVGLVAGIAVLLIAAFVKTPWVPHEHIETTEGTISGYVLSVDSGYLNILTEDHEFMIVVSGDVISRN